MVTTTTTRAVGNDHLLQISKFSTGRLLLFLVGCIVILAVKQVTTLWILVDATSATTYIPNNETWPDSPQNKEQKQGEDWWMNYVDRIARPFHPWNGTRWCHIDLKQSLRIQKPAHSISRNGASSSSAAASRPFTLGLMLAKVHKAASTTAASVTLRIAHRVAHRMTRQDPTMTISPYVTPLCHAHFYHEFAQDNFHSHRDFLSSFLWGTVRLPHVRSESALYYYLPEKEHGGDHDQQRIQYLELSKGHQLRLLRRREEALFLHQGNLCLADQTLHPNSPLPEPHPRFDESNTSGGGYPPNSIIQSDPERLALEYIQKQVLQHYDFVAVVERWMESMAVLKLLLPEVQYSDVIALRVKEKGSYVSHLDDCKYNPPFRDLDFSPVVQSYLKGRFRQTNPDYLLYAAVNRSLDLTIDQLGRERVEEGVRQIQSLQHRAEQICRVETILPCSAEGKRQPQAIQNCYVRDFGCGHRCLDRVLEDGVHHAQ